jgi:hypothetical protein
MAQSSRIEQGGSGEVFEPAGLGVVGAAACEVGHWPGSAGKTPHTAGPDRLKVVRGHEPEEAGAANLQVDPLSAHATPI